MPIEGRGNRAGNQIDTTPETGSIMQKTGVNTGTRHMWRHFLIQFSWQERLRLQRECGYRAACVKGLEERLVVEGSGKS